MNIYVCTLMCVLIDILKDNFFSYGVQYVIGSKWKKVIRLSNLWVSDLTSHLSFMLESHTHHQS